MKAMRRTAARTLGKMNGRSFNARLVVNRCDLGWDSIRAPIMAWAAAIWDGRVRAEIMQRAWMHGQTTVARALRPMASVGGAAGAFLASLSRIVWKSPSPDALITLDGTILRLDTEAPRTVGRHLFDDCQVVVASEASLAKVMAAEAFVRGHAAGDMN